MSKRIAVNAGGSFVPGLNAVLAGAVLAAHELGDEIVAIDDGYEGLLFPDRYREHGLTKLSLNAIDGLLQGVTPELGHSRINPFHVRTVRDECVEEEDRSGDVLTRARTEDINGIISVVGRKAMSVALKLERKGLKTLCVPESVENDVADTASFGFNSTLGFCIELLGRIRSSARAARKIAVVEVLGEQTGWLALQAGIASLADAILIPEIRYDLDEVAERLKSNARGGRIPALVVVAEGARQADRSEMSGGAKDGLEEIRRALSPGASADETGANVIRRAGHASDIVMMGLQRRANRECFSLVLDHILRGGQISHIDRQIGLAYGAAALRRLHDGHSGEMVAIQPPHLAFVPLVDAVNRVRTVPANSELLATARALGITFGGVAA